MAAMAVPTIAMRSFSPSTVGIYQSLVRRGDTSSEMTTREAYAAMLKDVISPRLRTAGFKGSSGSYVWPSETHWIQVGFQKMTGFDPVVRFTVNLTVISKPEWETLRHRYPGTGARPAPTHSFSTEDSHWWDRLTSYVPEHDFPEEDGWWRVNPRPTSRRSATKSPT
jgi:hypothetical protein